MTTQDVYPAHGKRCSRCGEVKPADTAHFRPAALSSGLGSYCRDSGRAYCRAWRAAHRDAVADYRRRRREANSAGRGVRACVVCGSTFAPARRSVVTCSDECRRGRRLERERARDARRRAKRREAS